MALTAQQVGLLALVVNSGGTITKELNGADQKVAYNLQKKGALRVTRTRIPVTADFVQRHILATGHAPRPRYNFTLTVLDGALPLV
jgi:hypothetical protein